MGSVLSWFNWIAQRNLQRERVTSMPRKPNPPPDNPEQSKRFIETAREIETDESRETFERTFKKIAKPPKAKSDPN